MGVVGSPAEDDGQWTHGNQDCPVGAVILDDALDFYAFDLEVQEDVELLGFRAHFPSPAIIETVQHGGWAERHGLLAWRDELVVVQSHDILSMGEDEFVEKMQERPLLLTVHRHSEENVQRV